MQELKLVSGDIEAAKVMACDRLVQALNQVNDPMMLMQLFTHGKDTPEFSSNLIHRWPTNGHRNFRLEWASTEVYADFKIQHYVSSSDEKVYKKLPADLIRVKLYVLKNDLESAAAGRTPGLQIPMRQNADMLE
ncbi:hypothetical protein BGW41_002968 [Actinomortierella wolfii]|nr:hypothetical protein BGW41_002968 [Actinomortierella wolfii]